MMTWNDKNNDVDVYADFFDYFNFVTRLTKD
jgi:hypothetical protein